MKTKSVVAALAAVAVAGLFSLAAYPSTARADAVYVGGVLQGSVQSAHDKGYNSEFQHGATRCFSGVGGDDEPVTPPAKSCL